MKPSRRGPMLPSFAQSWSVLDKAILTKARKIAGEFPGSPISDAQLTGVLVNAKALEERLQANPNLARAIQDLRTAEKPQRGGPPLEQPPPPVDLIELPPKLTAHDPVWVLSEAPADVLTAIWPKHSFYVDVIRSARPYSDPVTFLRRVAENIRQHRLPLPAWRAAKRILTDLGMDLPAGSSSRAASPSLPVLDDGLREKLILAVALSRADRDGYLTIHAFQKKTGLSLADAEKTLACLVKGGWLQTLPNRRDIRVTVLTPTIQARRLLEIGE